MFTKQQVQDMIESDLRKQVLVPLLRAMNFQSVHEYHGNTEFGKDIVCWKFDELHNRKNLALVVKATHVSGQSKAAADIENQVRQCFSKPYIDLITGSNEEVDRCWIVSNKAINHVLLITLRLVSVMQSTKKVSSLLILMLFGFLLKNICPSRQRCKSWRRCDRILTPLIRIIALRLR
jgi:hypothetical protein